MKNGEDAEMGHRKGGSCRERKGGTLGCNWSVALICGRLRGRPDQSPKLPELLGRWKIRGYLHEVLDGEMLFLVLHILRPLGHRATRSHLRAAAVAS